MVTTAYQNVVNVLAANTDETRLTRYTCVLQNKHFRFENVEQACLITQRRARAHMYDGVSVCVGKTGIRSPIAEITGLLLGFPFG